MNSRNIVVAVMLALGGLLILLAPGATPPIAAQGTGGQGPIVDPIITPGSFDGSLASINPVAPADINYQVIPAGLPFGAASVAAVSDPVVQSGEAVGTMPSPGRTFAGLSFNASCNGGRCGGGWPPDPNSDVGPNHIVETVNTSIGVFNKTGGRQLGITFNAFWSQSSTTTPCNGHNVGDPVVIYDPLANRWVITDIAFARDGAGNPKPPYYECIAVSKSGDPVSGGWWYYPILADSSSFNDYPKFAVWPDAYYMTANMFAGLGPGDSPSQTASPNSFSGARVWAFDRSKMINGQPIQPIHFDVSTAYASLLVGNLRGALPPSGSPAYVASIDIVGNNIHVWKLHFDPVTPSSSTFTGPVNIPVAAYVAPCNAANFRACIPEKGVAASQYVDGLGDRLMMQLQYRRIGGIESLWATHTVANSSTPGSQTGIRWYQLNVTGGNIATVPLQQSTYKPADGIFRWMPSLAVDKYGNMAIGFSASSPSMYPGIRYAGRLSTDVVNSLGQGEAVLFNGSGSQSSYPPYGPLNRWGDYTSLTVDPSDDCTFWYTNEYYAATGYNWKTRIGSFSFPQCAVNGKALVDESAPGVIYDGWQGVADASASGGSFRVSDTTGDKASFTFSGTLIKWVYLSGPEGGNAQVVIDGMNKGAVSLYSASKQYGVTRLYGGLANATHTITVQVLGTHEAGSTGNQVVVDSFVAGGVTTEDTNKAIKYNTWIGAANQAATGGVYRYSQTLNDAATFTFTGTAVQWLAVKGKGYGKAEVFIDNADRGTVDLYSPTLVYQAGFSYSGLSAAAHTLKILVLHTKNPAATGYKVAVDAFIITP